MLRPHEILARLPSAKSTEVFASLHEHHKPVYKATVESLAKAHNLRPLFIERKPRSEQYLWLADKARRRQNDGIAAHILQAWLVGSHKHLLCAFLDGLAIPHDDNGTVETLPPSPSREALSQVIESLRPHHDPLLLAIYLNTFQSFDAEGWPALAQLIEDDPSLQLQPQP